MSVRKAPRRNYRRHWNSNTLGRFLVGLLPTIPLELGFVYGLNKSWYDGLSVAAAFYIGIALLVIICNFAEFQHFKRIKELFVIKRETTHQPLTKFEQEQMRLLGVNYDKLTPDQRRPKDKGRRYFLAALFLIYGLVLLMISLPFLFG